MYYCIDYPIIGLIGAEILTFSKGSQNSMLFDQLFSKTVVF